CSGAHYKTVVISMRKAGGDANAKPYLQYTFATVFVTRVNWTGAGDEGPTESITFTYGALEVQYTKQSSSDPKPYAKKGTYIPCMWCPQ
ncbi:MAG: type VI secretion system tube protein Hcp, partial [Candidatus Eiseniibacteriota bacterium]